MIVGVFGGSFNPPHVAHVLAAAYVLSVSDVDKVLVIPTYRHPFAKALAPYEHRVTMCELAMAWLPRVEVSRVEETLGGESKTVRTLEHLTSTHPDWKLRLIMGADLLLESPKWFGFDRIRELAPPLVLGRAGVSIDAPGTTPELLPALSSTEIREKLAARAWTELAPLLPREVLSYIRAKGLYATGAAGATGA